MKIAITVWSPVSPQSNFRANLRFGRILHTAAAKIVLKIMYLFQNTAIPGNLHAEGNIMPEADVTWQTHRSCVWERLTRASGNTLQRRTACLAHVPAHLCLNNSTLRTAISLSFYKLTNRSSSYHITCIDNLFKDRASQVYIVLNIVEFFRPGRGTKTSVPLGLHSPNFAVRDYPGGHFMRATRYLLMVSYT
jgi:hypothetical protein